MRWYCWLLPMRTCLGVSELAGAGPGGWDCETVREKWQLGLRVTEWQNYGWQALGITQLKALKALQHLADPFYVLYLKGGTLQWQCQKKVLRNSQWNQVICPQCWVLLPWVLRILKNEIAELWLWVIYNGYRPPLLSGSGRQHVTSGITKGCRNDLRNYSWLQLCWTSKSAGMRKVVIKLWDECDRIEKSCLGVLREEWMSRSSRFSEEVTGCVALAAIACCPKSFVRILHRFLKTWVLMMWDVRSPWGLMTNYKLGTTNHSNGGEPPLFRLSWLCIPAHF